MSENNNRQLNRRKLIVLTGPTAIGKTDLSLRLAREVNGEIISADSVQVYKHLNIGSAKIMPDEMQGIKHHLIDVLEPSDDFSVADFKVMADKAMDEIYLRGHIPIITGGTGFYIQAVLKDIDFKETEDDGYRTSLERLAEEKGSVYLHDILRAVDSESADSIHANNIKRVIRALEYYHQTGRKISEHNKEEGAKESPYNFAYFVLDCDRSKLYERIEKRIDLMLENGLVDEVRGLVENYGVNRYMVSMQGLGYKEILQYLDGEVTLEEAIYILKRDTRHFAKRQLTWFKREKDVVRIDKDILATEDEQMEFMLKILSDKNII